MGNVDYQLNVAVTDNGNLVIILSLVDSHRAYMKLIKEIFSEGKIKIVKTSQKEENDNSSGKIFSVFRELRDLRNSVAFDISKDDEFMLDFDGYQISSKLPQGFIRDRKRIKEVTFHLSHVSTKVGKKMIQEHWSLKGISNINFI